MRVSLVYPPCCDPTAPYISLPVLTGYLRSRGVSVRQLDANAGGFRWLLREETVTVAFEKVRQRFGQLDGRPSLDHPEALEYAILAETLEEGASAKMTVTEAVSIMRGLKDFYDYGKYGEAADSIEYALAVLSAAYYPLRFSFSSYRKPFSLMNPDEMKQDAKPENNPFDGYFRGVIVPWVREGQPGVLGISAAFLSQLQPAWNLAVLLRREFPDLALVLGGSAATQFFLNMPEDIRGSALAPFDAAVLFEGEETLYDIAAAESQGKRPSGIISGRRDTNLKALPPPDFDGLDLDDYLSPEIVLPYDAARGCYWGGCAFCHYGLTDKGTASYRERGAESSASDLRFLAEKYRCRIFYLSEDTISPKTLSAMAETLAAGGPRWATDMRAEKSISAGLADTLKKGGCLALSVGLESGSERVLKLIGKGIAAADMEAAVRTLAREGIAVEIMCFSDFPTETFREAMDTIHLLGKNVSSVSLFMFGEFKLTAGSAVARDPEKYGIRGLYHVAGDSFLTELFFIPQQSWKTERERNRFDGALERLSGKYRMRPYPWAGSLSTAHTLLWYDRFGPDVFKRLQPFDRAVLGEERPLPRELQYGAYDLDELAFETMDREAEIWRKLLFEKRQVSRKAYAAEAAAFEKRLPVRAAFSEAGTGAEKTP
ncbi:MAG: radical SAM protein [Spirochaetales bacterium]|nr:MAG: radical SAM protein [Spirochaetales bacterium]